MSFHNRNYENVSFSPLFSQYWNHTRNDDQQQQDYDAYNDPDPHLHILPEHLLANTIRPTTEVCCGVGKALSLVAKSIYILSAFLNPSDVLAHNAYGVVDLLVEKMSVTCYHIEHNHCSQAVRPNKAKELLIVC